MKRKFSLRYIFAMSSASIVAVSTSTVSSAQDVSEASDEQFATEGLGDIVVTAQRREQSLQQIPVAVTAIGGDELQARNIQSANALVGVVPGFAIRDAGASIQYNLRGYISTDARANSDGPVAVYIDDVFLGSSVQQQMQTLDVERVEALRGPQGTLFGRNAVGGLVHFISRKPTDILSGSAGIQYGSYNQVIADAAIGGPIAEGIAGRVSIKYNRDDGWQKNLLGGKDRDSKDAVSGRAQLKIDLAPNLEHNLSFQIDHQRNQYQGYSAFGALNAAGTAQCSYEQIRALECFVGGAPFSNVPAGTKSLATYNPKRIYSTIASNPDNYDAQLAISRLDWDLDGALKLSSITAWGHAKRSFIEDDNATGLRNNDDFNLIQHRFSSKQFTQELRAAGRLGDVEYVAGIYYLTSRKRLVYQLLDTSASTVINYLYPLERLKTETLAGFAQAELPLTSTLTAIGGARYTWERKSLGRKIQRGFGTLGPLVDLPDSSGSLSKFTGKIGLQFTPSADLMLYGHLSTGFKSAEYPSDGIDMPLALTKPETITAIEIGGKSSLFDNRVRLNISGFLNTIKDKQSVTSIRDQTTGAQVSYFINFGDVRQKGFEVELTGQPLDGLTLAATVAYIDNGIRPRPGVTVQRLAFFETFALDGNQLPGVPPWQETLSVDWRLPIRMDGDITAHVDWRWQSGTFWNISNNSVEREPSYNVGNVSLTYAAPDNKYTVSAFVNNVTNTYYSTVNFSFGGADALIQQWARPRWAGIRAAVNF